MERTDEVVDQYTCRESDLSVNQESAKGARDYFERFFTDRKEVATKKDGRKCRMTEGYCSLCVSALQQVFTRVFSVNRGIEIFSARSRLGC